MLIAKKSKEGLNEVNISLIFDAPIPKKFTKTLKRLQESTSKKTLIRNYRGQKKKWVPNKNLIFEVREGCGGGGGGGRGGVAGGGKRGNVGALRCKAAAAVTVFFFSFIFHYNFIVELICLKALKTILNYNFA